MSFPPGIAATFVLFALGCSGKTATTGGGDGGGSSSGSNAGSSSGSSASGTTSGASSSSGSSSGASSSGGSSSGAASDASDTLDAGSVEVPDAFPATCSASPFTLRSDGGANQCAFKPSDVVCDANADCVAYIAYGCGCFDDVWGVNRSSTARCIPPPCVPLMQACDPDASGLYTQECKFVANGATLAAACVNHRCMSFAP